MNPADAPVRLEVDLGRDDFAAASGQIIVESPFYAFALGAQRRAVARLLVVATIVGLVAIAALLAGEGPDWMTGLVLAVLGFALLVGILGVRSLSPRALSRRSESLMRAAVDAGRSSWRPGRWTFEADADGATWRNHRRTVHARWAAVVKIIEAPAHVIVLDADASVMILPRGCFRSPAEAERLAGAMRSLVEDARAARLGDHPPAP